MGNPGEYRKWGIWVSTGKGRIRESTGNGGSGKVSEKYKSGRVPEKGLDEYREKDWRRGRIRASTGEPPD